MSQHRAKKCVDTKDKAAFFAARTPHLKQAEIQAQDGAEAELHADFADTHEASADTPLTPNLLQKMLDAAVLKMQASFTSALAKINNEITDLDARASQLEEKMEVNATAHAAIEDRLEDIERKLSLHETKITDAEDRSRRNNIRLRGVPEDVEAQDLTAFTMELFRAVLPDIPADMLLLDRIHRIPRPQHLPPTVPRDVLMRLHYYHTKDQILRAHRTRKDLPDKFKPILLFTDLSAETLRRRRSFKPVAEALRHHRIPYRWGYPAKLLITKGGKQLIVASPKEGLELLHKWDIAPNLQTPGPRKTQNIDGRPQRQRRTTFRDDDH
ncbi:Hypothetical predicted protein [Pelobates cultripes]|uniref:Transposase element L1Md-A101/L1Md-A102/L1Md-A2 n=2 Tax=Pelobates cultripes TaxID=61616 RepID=A0AAD1R2J2_PELCU|nr:Hypothetical predicted protein [Pelobates cultripes]